MSRFKEIFKNRPEMMSSIVKWAFGLPLAYVVYIVVSLLLPNVASSGNAIIVSQTLRSLLLTICIFLVIRFFLKIDPTKLFNENRTWSHRLGLRGFFTMLTVLVITNLCLFFIMPKSISVSDFTPGFLLNWFCSLLLVLCAAFSEELIFRAYIAWFGKSNPENDFLTSNKKSVLLYSLVSAVLFSISHFSNPEVEKSAIFSMIFYFVFGFCLMLYFFKTKGIEYGLGVHIANNLFSAWILNYSDSVLPTQSLFVTNVPISFITVLQAVICLIFCTVMCPEK